jgi:hypothetical protein
LFYGHQLYAGVGQVKYRPYLFIIEMKVYTAFHNKIAIFIMQVFDRSGNKN